VSRYVLTGQPPGGGARKAVGPLSRRRAHHAAVALQHRGWREIWTVELDDQLSLEARNGQLQDPGRP
jgi:hypothetical protein